MGVTDFGWFEKGGAVRRATSPTNAVTLRTQGWKPTTAPADTPQAPEPVSLDLSPEPHPEPEQEEQT